MVIVSGLMACGKSASLSNLLGGSKKTSQSPKVDPLARPIQVAWTAARAKRCGFYFDATGLRSAFLAYEAGQGANGQQIKKYQQAYDFTIKTVTKNISEDPNYCNNKTRVEEIRADLQRHLQGDYTPRNKKGRS